MIRSRVRVFLLSIWLLFHESSSTSHSSSSLTISSNRVEQISWKPRAFVYEGFLTDEECDHMISIAKSDLKRSAVADNVSGKSHLSEVRTSSGMFVPKGKASMEGRKDSNTCKGGFVFHSVDVGLVFVRPNDTDHLPSLDMVVARIEDKIAAWTFLPVENGEDIQVLRYEHGQKYDPHYDYFSDKVNIVRGGHRIATVLMYLSNVTKGGETVFPSAEGSPRIRMRIYRNVRERELQANGTPDPLSLHAGCPVIEGEKWSATKWIHVSSFDKIIDAGDCKDENEHCERWAALGECWKNQEYMVGSTEVPGACRRSCKVC